MRIALKIKESVLKAIREIEADIELCESTDERREKFADHVKHLKAKQIGLYTSLTLINFQIEDAQGKAND